MTNKQKEALDSFVFNDDVFCTCIDDLVEHVLLDYNDDLSDMDHDWQARVELTRLESMIKFDKEWIIDRVDDERLDEDGTALEQLSKLLDKHKDSIVAIANDIPKLYYGTGRYMVITKKDLLECL